MKAFASKEVLVQHHTLGYKIDLYFPKQKLAIEIDEKRHKHRNNTKKLKDQRQ